MAPKQATPVKIDRKTARGDFYVTLSASAFGPEGKNDAEGAFVKLLGDKEAKVTTRDAEIRFGAAAGAILVSTDAPKQAALVVASVREMRKQTASGYETDARKGAVASPCVAIAQGAVSNLEGGAKVRKALRAVPASRRPEAAPQILADAKA